MIRPPTTGPIAVETPITAPITANARPRTGPGNSSWMKAVTAGVNTPPAKPCTTRKMTSWVSDWASPQAALARVNTVIPTRNTPL